MALTDTTFTFPTSGASAGSGPFPTPVATIEAHIGVSATNPFVANPKPPQDAPFVDPQGAYTGTVLNSTYSGVRIAIPA